MTRNMIAPLVLMLAVGVPASAETPTPFLQDATLAGSGGSLTATRVPVQTATGSIVYQDVTLLFAADPEGNLHLVRGYPRVQPSAPIVVSNFIPGAYAGPPTLANGKYLVSVSGPGAGTNGSTQWVLSPAPGADQCTYPQSAFWFTGAIEDSPLAARLAHAGLSSPDFSYGVAGGPCCTGLAGGGCTFFYNGALLGMTQIGDVLRIVSFSDSGDDHNSPTAQIDYTLSQ